MGYADSANGGATNWTGGQTKEMTAAEVGNTLANGLKNDPLVESITTVVVTGKKRVSDAYNWAFGNSNDIAARSRTCGQISLRMPTP